MIKCLRIRNVSADNPLDNQEEMEFYRLWNKVFSPRANKQFLKEFGTRLLKGMELSDDLRIYLGLALIDIADGKSVRQAFNMPGKGRPKDKDALIRDMRIAIAIAKLMRDGVSLENASYKVTEDFNVSEHTAKKAYKDHLTMIKSVTEFQLLENGLDRLANNIDPMVKEWLSPPKDI